MRTVQDGNYEITLKENNEGEFEQAISDNKVERI
jgi:hypothetical protein